VILVGLTGGIGSGKSSVSTRLATLGAVVVDADAIVHRLQRPGTDVHAAIVRRFGTDVLDADGHLVRPRLAAMVFGDAGALADLNAIVHPAVAREMNGEVDAQRSTNNVVVIWPTMHVHASRNRRPARRVARLPTGSSTTPVTARRWSAKWSRRGVG